MKRWLIGTAAAVLALVAGVAVLQIVASETGEVVVLHARDQDGAVRETRLWIADLDGRQYLRGTGGTGWFRRLSAVPTVEVERAGALAAYLAVPEPERRVELNAAMRAKYGWRDAFISATVGGRDQSIPVRLEPR